MKTLNLRSSLPIACLSVLLSLSLGACDKEDGESTSEGSASEGSDSDSSTSGGSSSDSSTSDGSSSDSSTSDGSSSDSSSSSSSDTNTTSTGTTGMTSMSTGSSGSDTDTDTDTDTTGDPGACGDSKPIADLVTSMAYLESQVPPDMTSGGSSGSSGGDDLDPNTLFIHLSDQDFTCKDPSAILQCGPHWGVTIVLPPEHQSPGVYAFGPGEIIGFFTETAMDEGGDQCAFGGGTWSGTLEIVAIDDTLVEGRFCNVDELWAWNNPELNGTFYAERCQ